MSEMSSVVVAETALLSDSEFLIAHTRRVMSLVKPNHCLVYGDEALNVTHDCMQALMSLPFHLATVSPSLFAACAVQSYRIIGSLMTTLIGHYGFRNSLSASETKSLFVARAALHHIVALLPHRPLSLNASLPHVVDAGDACKSDLVATYVARRARDIENVGSKRVSFATLLRARRFKMNDARALQNVCNGLRDSESVCQCTTNQSSCGLRFQNLLRPVELMTPGSWFIVKDLYFNVLRTAASHMAHVYGDAMCVNCKQSIETCLNGLMRHGASFSTPASALANGIVDKLQHLPWHTPLPCDTLPSLSPLDLEPRPPSSSHQTEQLVAAPPNVELDPPASSIDSATAGAENRATCAPALPPPRRSTRMKHARSLLHPVLVESALYSPKRKRACDRHKTTAAVK